MFKMLVDSSSTFQHELILLSLIIYQLKKAQVQLSLLLKNQTFFYSEYCGSKLTPTASLPDLRVIMHSINNQKYHIITITNKENKNFDFIVGRFNSVIQLNRSDIVNNNKILSSSYGAGWLYYQVSN